MTHAADPRVHAYIDARPDWQQAICREVRDLVHTADHEVAETIKRTNRPYFVLQGNICALLAATDHVNVFLYDGAIVPDPAGIITGGYENKSARTSQGGMASRRRSNRRSRSGAANRSKDPTSPGPPGTSTGCAPPSSASWSARGTPASNAATRPSQAA